MAVNSTRSELHEAARAWAQAGFYVFPCMPQTKRPATTHGLNDATTDLDQIDRWWTDTPLFNIGVAPGRSAMTVLDVDPPLGADTLAALEADNGALPSTLTIRTPRGGLHHWFTGSCPSTVGKLGPKLDTRGEGGYVLVPPSVVVDPSRKIEGSYEYAGDENNIAAGPAWLLDLSKTVRDRKEASSSELDEPANVERARILLASYVASGKTAVKEHGADALTYEVACSMLSLGLSPRRAFEVMMEDWGPRSQPFTLGYTDEFIARKVQNAADYMQNDIGAWAVAPAAETFATFAAMAPDDAPAQTTSERSRFYPRDETEQDALKDPEWLIKDMLPAEGTAMIYGPPGSWKSFLALDIALTLASGIARYGDTERAPVPVVYVAAEGARGIVRLRRPAWRIAHHIDRPLPFYAIDTMPLVARPQDCIDLLKAIEARKIAPKLLVLDTVARMMAGKNENDAQDAGEFIEALDMLKRALGCTVLAIHHTGKDDSRGARGSNAFLGGVDTMLEVRAHHATKALALHVRKQKDADECETPWTFEGRIVGPSLVFFETDGETHRKLVKGDDQFNPAKVGQALRALQAIGVGASVSTLVLATHMTPMIQAERPEDRAQAVSRSQRTLAALAKLRLEAYTTGEGRSLKWFLPED